MVLCICAQIVHDTPAAFPGLGDSDSHLILDLTGAEAGRCCPYLVLPDISSLLAPSSEV